MTWSCKEKNCVNPGENKTQKQGVIEYRFFISSFYLA